MPNETVQPPGPEGHQERSGSGGAGKVARAETSFQDRHPQVEGTATIVGFGKDYYELELDGLVIRAVRSEFIPINPEEDRKLHSSIQPRRSKDAEEPLASEDPLADLTVDLHIERIPGSDGVPEWAALEYQMNYFRQVLRKNLKHRGKRITFIHGVGDGVLASAIRKELDEVFAVSCSYTFGPMGATNVTIR